MSAPQAGPDAPGAAAPFELPAVGVEILFERQSELLRLLESLFNVQAHLRGNRLSIEGTEGDVGVVSRLIADFAALVSGGLDPDRESLRRAIRGVAEDTALRLHDFFQQRQAIQAGQRKIFPKSRNQIHYVEAIRRADLVFAIGPAGTGKTFLAVALAVSMLLEKRVARIILARPAVEAGERLGFLPGDLQQKVNPYLRPLYDALHHMLDFERVQKLIERETIEIAPLAFMRGRTLADSFVILDEAQNTTAEQMKMFLTRIGLGSKVVVTGDVTQIDLPPGRVSGLIQARSVLQGVGGIRFCTFDQGDVVRHALVQLIVNAYERFDAGGAGGASAESGPPAGPEGPGPGSAG